MSPSADIGGKPKVFVPWAKYDICKYWMLNRCLSGDSCKWKHPDPKEKKRLWDEHTRLQREKQSEGDVTSIGVNAAPGPLGPNNAPPPPPRPSGIPLLPVFGPTRADFPTAFSTESTPLGPPGPNTAPPPPPRPPGLPPLPLFGPSQAAFPIRVPPIHLPTSESHVTSTSTSQTSSQATLGQRFNDAMAFVTRAETSTPVTDSPPDMPGKVTLWHEKKGKQKQSKEVSMLDAPPSPKKHKGVNSLPLGGSNANTEPLSKPNRLQNTRKDLDLAASTRTSSLLPVSSGEADGKKTDHKDDAGPHTLVTPVNASSESGVTTQKSKDNDGDTRMTESTNYIGNQPKSKNNDADTRMIESSSYIGNEPKDPRLKRKRESAAKIKEENQKNLEAISGRRSFPMQPPPQTPAVSKGQLRTSLIIPKAYSSPFAAPQRAIMGATKRLSNGEAKHIGPHPSTIRVSAPYLSQNAVEKKLQPPAAQAHFDVQERSIAEAREDSMRLQGCAWIDNVRRALQLPIRTYTTACMYYHKFRLAHPGILNGMEYGSQMVDACAASLLTSCKVEDTLKKSRDVLAAAYNLKAGTHDQLGSDDPHFEAQSRQVIGLERMVLEAGGFDFRSKYPHKLLAKIVKMMPEGQDGEREKVGKVAWTVLTDLHRTFAPLKQTSATMALASLELAAHLFATTSPNNVSAVRDELQQTDVQRWSTSREEIMETLLDLLDLYTQHTTSTVLGTKYSLDDFLRIRLALNKECNENSISRHTAAPASDRPPNGSTLRVANGHPTPVSPPQTGAQQLQNANGNSAAPESGGTLRFMLNPQLASDEMAEVQKYFVEEWEEYEEEIEVPVPRAISRERPSAPPSARDGSRSERGGRDSLPAREDRERERLRDRERELERERASMRDRDRESRRFDDRRFEDRRFDDRRDRRYDDRRYPDERRRRDDRR